MGFQKELAVDDGHPTDKGPQEARRANAWQSELKELLERDLAEGDVEWFSLRLLHFLKVHCNSNSCQDSRRGIDIEPTIDLLPGLLRQLAESLKDQDERRFILTLVDSAVGLLNDEPAASVRRFREQSLNYLANCEAQEEGECSAMMEVAMCDMCHNSYQFPLRLSVVGADGCAVTARQDSILIDQEEHRLEQRVQQFRLASSGQNDVDLELSCTERVCFSKCSGITSLNISYTFICHIDVRELINLEELVLENTNVKRLNLASQWKLKSLCCDFTLIEYLELSKLSQLEELDIAFAGQLKTNLVGAGSDVFIDAKQTVDEHQCKSEIEEKMEEYIVSYPEASGNSEELKIILPEYCNQIIDRDIHQCKKLRISGHDEKNPSAVATLDIVDYSNLEWLTIEKIDCNHFEVADLLSLIGIEIIDSLIDDITLADFPNLQEIKILGCDCAGHLVMENCEKVEVVDITHTGIAQLDISELRNLKKLNVWCTSITELNVSWNTNLEELSVDGTKISHLDVSQLAGLRKLCAESTSITEIDVSRNVKLEELNVSYNEISILHVRPLLELKDLRVQNTGIRQLDISNNTELRELWVCKTAITRLDIFRNTKLECLNIHNTEISRLELRQVTELKKLYANSTNISELNVSENTKLEELLVHGTNISHLDVSELAELKKLYVHSTRIDQLDLSGNRQLIEVCASQNCRVMNCCCAVSFIDRASDEEAYEEQLFNDEAYRCR